MSLSYESLLRLVNNLPGMAYRCLNSRDWTMLFVSDGCFELTGYRPDELVDDRVVSYNALIQEDYRELIFHQAQKALNEKRPLKYSYPIVHKSGQERWVLEYGVGVYNAQGEPVELEGFISDITQIVEAEKKLEHANIFLNGTVRNSDLFCGMIGRSKAIRKVFNQILAAARSDASVVIYGESGTGKEMVARAIHHMSARRHKPLVPVNCGAIPENLIESEFFGYKKGAFSGAYVDKPGYLDQAEGGSLLLDEVGDIKPGMQIKLLRAIEDYGFMPVGGKKVHKPDVRIIAATNQDLKQQVKSGRMREDFFFRLHIIAIEVPPLRERREDIPLLSLHFLKKFGDDQDVSILPQGLTRSMMTYKWPGNVRELQNFIHRYISGADTEFFEFKADGAGGIGETAEGVLQKDRDDHSLQTWLTEFEKAAILKTLNDHNWHRGRAARALKIHYRSLLRKMKRYGILQT